MEELKTVENFLAWLKNPKNKVVFNLIIVFAVGFLFLSLAKMTEPQSRFQKINDVQHIGGTPDLNVSEQSYEDKLEKQLADVLKKAVDVGDVNVMITLENDEMVEPAYNTINNQKNSEEKDSEGGIRSTIETQSNKQVVLLQKGGDDEPLLVKKYTPAVKGVLIVAEGASSSRIIDQITRATATVLDIPVYKIKVLPK